MGPTSLSSAVVLWGRKPRFSFQFHGLVSPVASLMSVGFADVAVDIEVPGDPGKSNLYSLQLRGQHNLLAQSRVLLEQWNHVQNVVLHLLGRQEIQVGLTHINGRWNMPGMLRRPLSGPPRGARPGREHCPRLCSSPGSACQSRPRTPR